jgi:hypothetical protein
MEMFMDEDQIEKLDTLTLKLNNDLAVLKSAVKDYLDLEVCSLEHFVERIYKDSEEIRNIFNGEQSLS